MRVDDDQLEYLGYRMNQPKQNVNNIYTFKHVIGSANTPEPLPSQENADDFDVVVKALFANAGTIYIGGSNAQAKNQGFSLRSNEVVSYGVKNCENIWVMASVAGEGVEVTCELPDVAEETEEEEEG